MVYVQVESMISPNTYIKKNCHISGTLILINSIPTAKSQLQSYLWTLGHYGTFDIIMNANNSRTNPFTYAIIIYSDRSKGTYTK